MVTNQIKLCIILFNWNIPRSFFFLTQMTYKNTNKQTQAYTIINQEFWCADLDWTGLPYCVWYLNLMSVFSWLLTIHSCLGKHQLLPQTTHVHTKDRKTSFNSSTPFTRELIRTGPDRIQKSTDRPCVYAGTCGSVNFWIRYPNTSEGDPVWIPSGLVPV